MILFNLDFETVSTCNRVCPTCLRNSHPSRDTVSPWFTPNYLPEDVIYGAIGEALQMPLFGGTVCLNHYNEPFTDERIGDITKGIKERFSLEELYFHSNGDLVTPEKAESVDGVADRIVFTLYAKNPVAKEKQHRRLMSMFHKTNLVFILDPVHVPTHYSPGYPVKEMAENNINHTCMEPSMRIVINHRRQYLLCCDDMTGNFGLGTYPETSLQEHWDQKMKMQERLKVFGGRRDFPHCVSCPRP